MRDVWFYKDFISPLTRHFLILQAFRTKYGPAMAEKRLMKDENV
jgi:hypothetical protein